MTLDTVVQTEKIIKRSRRDSVQTLPKLTNGKMFAHGNILVDSTQRGPLLPTYGTRERERALLRYYRHDYNNLFRSAIGVLTKQVQATPWEIKGDPDHTDYFQEVLLNADFGRGLESFQSKVIIDFNRYDAGAYIELIGPGDPLEPMTGAITGLGVLDALRCWPTGDPEYPVIYYDVFGAMHIMHHTRVVRFYDMPDTNENVYGDNYGECSLSRGIGAVNREILINRYIEQTMDDNPLPGLLVFKNITEKKLNQAIQNMEKERATDSGGMWGKTIRLYGLDADTTPEVVSIAYASPPDGFNYETMKNLNAREIAAAVGVDVQDFWELTGGKNLGTATQSAVLHEKAKGKTLGRILKSLERVLNQALPEALQFEFKYRDDQEDQAQATKAQTWIANAAGLQGILPPEAIARLLVNQVEAIRDVATDESGEVVRLPDDDPKSDEQIETSVALGDSEAQGTPTDAVAIDDTEKGLRETQRSFEDVFVRLVSQTNLDDTASRALVGQILRTQLHEHGEQIWLDGQRAGGNDTAVIDKDAERSIATWRAGQSPFVSKFTKDLLSKEFQSGEILNRAKLWVNKSLNPLYFKSLGEANKNGRFMWVVDPVKEHCSTCIKMNGQIHKMKDYIKSGILPQATVLECGGYNCGCKLTPTDLPSRGTFSRGRGGLSGVLRNIFQAARDLFRR